MRQRQRSLCPGLGWQSPSPRPTLPHWPRQGYAGCPQVISIGIRVYMSPAGSQIKPEKDTLPCLYRTPVYKRCVNWKCSITMAAYFGSFLTCSAGCWRLSAHAVRGLVTSQSALSPASTSRGSGPLAVLDQDCIRGQNFKQILACTLLPDTCSPLSVDVSCRYI